MTEILTTHQKIQEQHQRNTANFVGDEARKRNSQHIVTSDIEQIKMVLQSLVDMVTGLNLYVRSQYTGYQSKPNKSQATKTVDAISTITLPKVSKLEE